MSKQLITYIAVFLFLAIGTVAVILYGTGYRLNIGKGKLGLLETGLLVAKSQPDGASILINGHLTTATDNTIDLAPGEYKIRIVKDGYSSWEKTIKIQKEVVAKIDALLFTTTPKLESITDSGVGNPVMDPSNTQIAFTVDNQSIKKSGVYILDVSTRPILTLQSASTQIADNIIDNFSQASLSWSPDGKEILATISAEQSRTTYLLEASGFNQNPQDVTEVLTSINASWQKQKEDKEMSRIYGLKPKLKQLIAQNFQILSWSPDETKILYTASQSATLPLVITPPLLGTDATPDQREIKKDSIYVYDISEDKNYKISDGELSLSWFPDSKHLIFVANQQINIIEYDGGNKTTIYAGPFIDKYVFPWPDGSRLVILTNFGNPNITPNLYTVGLK